MRRMHAGRVVSLAVLLIVAMIGLSGCDYWPPALQAQIEQLRAEVQAATAEKAKAENQLTAANNDRNALQAKVDELTRLLKARADQVASLEQSLAAEKERVAKLSAKPAAKSSAKKKPAASAKKH